MTRFLCVFEADEGGGLVDGFALRHHAEGAQVIIGGDFNLASSEARAGTDRKPTKAEKAIHQRLRDELGLVNCWRLANPTAPLAQTLCWSRNPTIALHIYGLFVPLGWSRHLRGCSVIAGDEWQRLSDHNPVVAEFDFASFSGQKPILRCHRIEKVTDPNALQ